MISPKTTALTLLLNLSFSLAAPGQNSAGWDFETDPMAFHENLRRRAIEGIDNRLVLEKLHRTYREHSFDGLMRCGPKGNAGLILLYGAWTRWAEGAHDKALLLYSKAYDLFSDSGMSSEARFCLYYMARIATEREKFQQSILLLERALNDRPKRQEPYLEGLIHEALGYSLWYLDRLPESCESFGRAASLWTQIKYLTGQVNCWSNQGLLFQELGLPYQAWESYERAIESIQKNTFPEIKFHLYRNCALYHFRNNNQALAISYLLMSREFRACGEELYQLARAEILDEPSILEELVPEVPSIRFIRDLLLARQLRERGNTPAALLLTKEVIRGSRDAGMPRHTREARLALAEILSETSGAEEAARIFAEELESSLSLDQIDILLPFSNAACRQLDGLIRCQVRMGKIVDARETIHRAAMLKTEKCRQLLEKIRSQKHDRTHGLFAKTVLPLLEWDNQPPVKTDSLPGNATLIEFWPDGNEVFVWIDHQGSSKFVHLELGEWIQDSIPRLTGPLYQAGQILPPEPPSEMAAKLYTLLIEPVEGLIKTDRLLIIAHKELQSLPFEILLDRNGKLMIEKYCLSYLPGIHFLAGKGSVRKPSAEKGNYRHPPIMIIPEGFAEKRGPFQEMTSLRQTFPKLKIIGYPRNRNSIDASWIHISSHLKIDRRYWLNSTFHAAGSSFPMTRLLAIQTDCRLLSLGSCEPANSATGASPYWMGYSEILLLNGAESLLASRWRMDELSSPIYTEFFRLCRKGLPMDEALRISKLKFLHPGKNSLPVHARHPFYWSGITYIGKPGQRLYPTADAPSGATAAPLILWLVILAGAMLRDEIVAAKKAVLTKKGVAD